MSPSEDAADAAKSLGRPREAPAPPESQAGSLRSSLRLVTIAWLFGASWMYLAGGAALTQYAKQLGLSHFGFGVLAAIPFLGALAQLPASYFVERFGHRRAVFIGTGFAHRAMWLAIAAIPWFLPSAWWWLGLLGMIAAASMMANLGAPASMSWLADLVPNRIRGRYFSRRTQAAQLAAVAVIVVAGYAMDRASPFGGVALRRTISVLLAVAAVSGLVDFMVISAVSGPKDPPPNPRIRFWHLLRHPLADRNFRRFLGFNFTLTFATASIGQFLWLYLFDVAGMSNTQANILFVIVPLLVTFLAYPMWGRVTDRIGRKPVLLIAGLLIVPGAIPWMFMTKDSWLLPYLAVLVSSASWPGVDMASLNLLLGLTQSPAAAGDRALRLGSAYVAVNSLLVAVAGVMSGLFCGGVAEALRDWHGRLFGWPLTYHGILFFISAALRLLALGWLLGLQESRAYSTRAALRYISSDIYANLQQMIVLPTRFLTRFSQWTYKLYPNGRSRRKGP
jgi:MFS family permease